MSNQASAVPGDIFRTQPVFSTTCYHPDPPRAAKTVEVKIGWLESLQCILADLSEAIEGPLSEQGVKDWQELIDDKRKECAFLTRFE